MKKKHWKTTLGSSMILLMASGVLGQLSFAQTDSSSRAGTATNYSDSQNKDANAEAIKASGTQTGNLSLTVDHQVLDTSVKAAQEAGVKVTKGSDVDKGQASGADKISALQKAITEDYQTQSTALDTATSNYKKQLADYQIKEKAYEDALAAMQAAIDAGGAGAPMSGVGQGLHFLLNENPNANVSSVTFSGSGSMIKKGVLGTNFSGLSKLTTSDRTNSTEFYAVDTAKAVFGAYLDAGASMSVTYDGLKNYKLNGTSITKVVVTYKNPGTERMGFFIPKDPGNAFMYGAENTAKSFVNKAVMAQETMSFFNGNTQLAFQTVNGAIAQFSGGSLNYSKASTQAGLFPPNDEGYNQHESVSFNNKLATGKPYGQSTVEKVSGMPTSGANASGDSFGVNPPETNETWSASSYNDYTYNNTQNITPKFDASHWDVSDVDCYYGAMQILPNDGQKQISVTWHTTDANMWAVLNGQLPTKYEVPEPPVKPTPPSVSYHYDTAKVQPTNSKAVTNISGADLNGDLVNKQEVENWVLSNEALPAGHETVKSYEMTDVLPDGFVVDLAQTQKLTPDYEVTLDEKTNTVFFKAKAETLVAMNKDLTKAYEVPKATIQGKVTNDSAIYKNDFKTLINDYSVNSNVVDVHTDTVVPKKDNTNASGVTINGQGISDQTTNYYQLTWNLAPYKGIASSPEDIARGFYFVDAAPDCVNVDLKNISFKDSQGNAVTGITAKVYSSLSEAPAEVQKVLKDAKITPKSQFVFYAASDPQSFYDTYVQKGNDIKITQPMTLKAGASGTYQNTDYQIDFGNGYEGDTVKNNIVPPKVVKQVSVDGGKTWHNSKDLPDTDSNYDYKLDFKFTANGDYTKILLGDNFESSQWTDLKKAKVTDKDGNDIAGHFKVLNASGKDVTKDFNNHVFQKDGKKEVLQIIFTPDKISDITALASNSDPDRLVTLTMSFKEVTLKGASGAELANYLDKDGKIVTPNIGQLDTTSKTATGDNTKDEVTKSNVTKVIPPQLTPMINKYVYETGVGSSISLYDKGITLPSYLSKMAQFTSLNLNKDEKVKVGDTVHWLIAAQSGNKSLITNVVDTLPKELSFAENPNIKVFVLKNDGKLGDEVTSDWKIETKGQTLTATPNDPTKYFFVGSSTDSRVVITLDTTVNKDIQSGTFTNIATINTKDGDHKEDKANIHTKVDPVKAIVDIYLPKTGDSKSIMTAVGAWLVTVAAVVGGVVLNERKRHTLAMTYHKMMRKIRK
ncbi:SspB-related isopeptide-forming adhesin [Lactococcus lactis]|uniref:SspB-related isopeptide-forming adhesin n=1 Tax=Lactococcus lactis TaxID=1358 RepID=UPI0032E43291